MMGIKLPWTAALPEILTAAAVFLTVFLGLLTVVVLACFGAVHIGHCLGWT